MSLKSMVRSWITSQDDKLPYSNQSSARPNYSYPESALNDGINFNILKATNGLVLLSTRYNQHTDRASTVIRLVPEGSDLSVEIMALLAEIKLSA